VRKLQKGGELVPLNLEISTKQGRKLNQDQTMGEKTKNDETQQRIHLETHVEINAAVRAIPRRMAKTLAEI
jgi:hypothetical protein